MPEKDVRPNPEQLLFAASAEDKQGQGRLKIFLGAAPGVGKTYSMLEAAALKRREGLDVVAGVVETHGRKETQALVSDLEILPRKAVTYRGIELQEFDLDSALKRAPALILMDELAHTNAPGGRHAKRWQDVVEILERGIDVYATLNVQHIESLNDVIAKITGVLVRETVPDSMLERADVELVDLPPEELLERLHQGKVYIPEQIRSAAENFFKLPNLTALRELALRTTAEGVNTRVQSERERHAPGEIWATAERVLVCVGPSPTSAKLVRAAKRMAARLQAPWIALFVETPSSRLTDAQKAQAMDNLRLAEQLGGEALTLTAHDAAEGALDLARQRNVTKIVVGKQIRPRWREIFSKSLAYEIIRGSGDIDVYVITGEAGTAAPVLPAAPLRFSPPQEYGLSLLAVAVFTGICWVLRPLLVPSNIIMIYLLGAMLVAARGFRGPALLFSALSLLGFDFFFAAHGFALAIPDTRYLFTFGGMFVAAILISHLTLRMRAQADASRLGEMRTAAMHALSRELATARGQDALLRAGVAQISQVFDSAVAAMVPGAAGRLEIQTSSSEKQDLNEKERSVAQWVFDLGQSAGLGTQTLPVVEALYAPLLGSAGPVGVLRVEPRVRERLLIPDQMLLLESFAHQLALALEVDRLQEDARAAQIETEKERLRSSLLSSISHDLRTPLAAIIGSATSLLQNGKTLPPDKSRELLEDIQDEGERLSRLVHNLIETTRLEAGAALKKEPCAAEEIVGSALERAGKILSGRAVRTDLPADLPLVPMDAVLMEQAVFNLLENVARHTPKATPVEISARRENGAVILAVADRGPGLSAEAIGRVFDKFYRSPSSSGAGLGLAVCRAVVSAHGGKIWAQNREGGGAIFQMSLPL